MSATQAATEGGNKTKQHTKQKKEKRRRGWLNSYLLSYAGFFLFTAEAFQFLSRACGLGSLRSKPGVVAVQQHHECECHIKPGLAVAPTQQRTPWSHMVHGTADSHFRGLSPPRWLFQLGLASFEVFLGLFQHIPNHTDTHTHARTHARTHACTHAHTHSISIHTTTLNTRTRDVHGCALVHAPPPAST